MGIATMLNGISVIAMVVSGAHKRFVSRENIA
jgi:hypothetical protein